MPSGEMETRDLYSVDTKNKYDMISNDSCDDPFELIRAAQEQPRKEKDTKAPKGKKDVKPLKTNDKKFVKIETTADNESSESKYELELKLVCLAPLHASYSATMPRPCGFLRPVDTLHFTQFDLF